MGEKIKVDVQIFDQAIHIIKNLTHDEHLRRNGKLFKENHFEGHLKWAVQLLYDSVIN